MRKVRYYMVDSLRYKDWLEKAQRDIRAAKVLKENSCGNDIVAFHAQQAIVKVLKGYLLKETSKIVEGHSLIYLCKNAAQTIGKLKSKLKDCAFVNQYYIETRYPADAPLIVTDEEVNECISISEQIYAIILENL